MNTLILLGDIDWLALSMKASGLVDVACVYKKCSKLSKPLFRLHHHVPALYHRRHIWYGEWKERLEQYDTIILFDAFEDADIVEYIKQKRTGIRLIVYYYNPIYNETRLENIQKVDGVEIWSFDKQDCKKYQLQYNPQFYFYELRFPSSKNKNQSIDYKSDVFFIGKDKGRLKSLMNLGQYISKLGFYPRIMVVADRKKSYSKEEKRYLSKSILYKDCVEYVKNAGCLLDIVQSGQMGMSLRIMEAMFFDKKLITNNTSIKENDFYNRGNIYFWGNDKRNMREFLRQDDVCWNKNIREIYEFHNWLNRFFMS